MERRSERRPRWRWIAVAFSAALVTVGGPPTDPSAAQEPPVRPNFVVIVTDDQRWDTIGRCRNGFDGADLAAGADSCMPELQRLLVPAGTAFTRAYVTTALCCPSRASVLTGNYARHTGVIDNRGLPLFDDDSTIATWLDAAGYRTALIGKYMNGYGETPGAVPNDYVPPGWDSWHAFWGLPGYSTYSLVEREPGQAARTISISGSTTSPTPCAPSATYSTDLLCRRALDFVSGDPTDPFFLYFTPFAPHGPGTPPSRYSGAYAGLPLQTYPSYNAVPSPNPPSWLPTEPLTGSALSSIGAGFRAGLNANRAVDDAIAALHAQLTEDGTLDETVWVFLSDNGLARAEHRWSSKGCAYEECHRVPLVIACPPAICPTSVGGRVDGEHLALNIDVAPTILELAGIPPAEPMDGRSLVTLLGGDAEPWRDAFLLEDHGIAGSLHGPLGVMSREEDGHLYKYVTYVKAASEFELYDLTTDPWELTNLWNDPAHEAVQTSLAGTLSQMWNPPRLTLDGPSGDLPASSATFTWTSDEAAEFECSLDGAAPQPCGSGLDGSATLVGLSLADHTFSLTGTDGDNNRSLPLTRSFRVTADTTAPDTPILLDAPPDPSGQDVSFDFTSPETGVSFACSLDGAEPGPCEPPVALTGLAHGPHVFAVEAVDAAGNRSTPVSHAWNVVDSTAPPTPRLTITPSDPSSPDVRFSFEDVGEGDRAECALDDAEPAACGSPVLLEDLSEGEHVFRVRATDEGGNPSGSASFTWTVDDQPAAPTLTTLPPESSGPDVSFGFESSDPAAGFACSLDDAPFAACSSPAEYTGLHEGAHVFRVRSEVPGDASGAASHAWVVDGTPPDPPRLTSAPPPLSGPDVTFEFSADDPGTTFVCSLDDEPFAACTSPTTRTELADGGHSFGVRAVDDAGNTSAPTWHAWVVDTTPPAAPLFTGTPPDPSTATASFSFAAEAGASFTCSVDGAAPSGCLSPHTLMGLTGGSHTFEVHAVDAAGNRSNPSTFSWTVDASAPTVSVRWPPVDALLQRNVVGMQWTGTDDRGVVGYDVLQRLGTTGSQSLVASTTANAYTTTGEQGLTYCFQVVARDLAGNVGVGGERCAAVPVDDRHTGIVVDGVVGRIAAGTAFDGTLTALDGAGERLTTSFTGHRIGIMARMDAGSGMVDIALDGGTPTRVDLYSPSTRDRVYVWVASVPDGSHTITISWSGVRNTASSGTTVSIDGIGHIGPAP